DEAEARIGWACWAFVFGLLEYSSSLPGEAFGGESQTTFRTLLLWPSNVRRQVYVDKDQILMVRSPEPLARSPRELLVPPSLRLISGVFAGAKRIEQTPRLCPWRMHTTQPSSRAQSLLVRS